jgi:hypothetical protein
MKTHHRKRRTTVDHTRRHWQESPHVGKTILVCYVLCMTLIWLLFYGYAAWRQRAEGSGDLLTRNLAPVLTTVVFGPTFFAILGSKLLSLRRNRD